MTAPSLPLHHTTVADSPVSVAVSALPPLPRGGRADGLSEVQRRCMLGAIVAVHVAGAWGLMQIGAVREAVRETAPMFVQLIAPAIVPPAPPPVTKPEPIVRKIAPPRPVIAAAPSPAPQPFVVPEPRVVEAPPPAPEVVSPSVPSVAVAPPPSTPVAPAPPKDLLASSVQYASTVAPDYPRLSRRNGEAGRTVVRVFIDDTGTPRQVQLAGSSGHERLDASALAAVLKFRFKPPTENGQPVSGWANVPIDFGLEK